MLLLLGIIALVVLMLLSEVPVSISFGLGALLYVIVSGRDISYLLPHGFWILGNFAVLAMPLFVISGALMSRSGITERLIRFVNAFVGRTKGGLGCVSIITCALFGTITGSGASTVAAVGGVLLPQMIKEGYPPGYATALIGCSAVLGQLIPPNVPLIIFAVAAQLPVAACFLATVGSGITIVITFSIINFLYIRRIPEVKVAPRLHFGGVLKEIGVSTKQAIFALLLPVLILGGIYSGMATPTEVAAIALVYTIPVGFFIYRGYRSLGEFGSAILQGAISVGAIATVLFFMFVMSRAIILEQIPMKLANLISEIAPNKYAALAWINVLLLIIGMLVDDASGGIMAAIFLMPLVKKFGIHPIHFAGIVGVNLGLGNATPPCAPLLYMAGALTGLPLDKYVKPAVRFMALGHLPILLLVTYIPDLALWLPRVVMGIQY